MRKITSPVYYLSYPSMIFVPAFRESGGILKLICPSVCQSVRLSVSPSVTKTLTWLISFEVLMIEHWYLACMILVTSPFYWYHAVTLTFDLLQGQMCCRAGDHNSSNLLVSFTPPLAYPTLHFRQLPLSPRLDFVSLTCISPLAVTVCVNYPPPPLPMDFLCVYNPGSSLLYQSSAYPPAF